MKKSLPQNTLYLLIGNSGGTVLAFLLSVLIGRMTGETGLAVYSVVLAWIFSLSMFVDAGFSTLLTRDLAQVPELTEAYLQVGVKQRLWLGIVACLALWLGAPFLSGNSAIILGLRLSAPLLLIEPFFALFTAIFRAHQRMLPIAYLNIGMVLVQVGLVLAVFYLGYGIQAALTLNVLTSLGRLYAAWWIYRSAFAAKSMKQQVALLPLLKFALPFAVAAILAAAQQRLSLLQLEWLADIRAVGHYAAVGRFMEAGRMLPNAYFGALFPYLAELALSPQNLYLGFGRILLALLIFGVLQAVAAYTFGETLLRYTYGESFVGAADLLGLSFVLLIPTLLRSALTLYWYAKKRVDFVNRLTAFLLILQLGLGYLVIPYGGAEGLLLVLILVECLAVGALARR